MTLFRKPKTAGAAARLCGRCHERPGSIRLDLLGNLTSQPHPTGDGGAPVWICERCAREFGNDEPRSA